jgi:hypothetical protein
MRRAALAHGGPPRLPACHPRPTDHPRLALAQGSLRRQRPGHRRQPQQPGGHRPVRESGASAAEWFDSALTADTAADIFNELTQSVDDGSVGDPPRADRRPKEAYFA